MDSDAEAARRLREELLYDGLYDWVSMSLADARADKHCPEVPKPQRPEFVLGTLRALVADGLFQVGNLDTGDGRFGAFDEPLDDVITRIRRSYIDNHNDTHQWAFRFWFDITDKGSAAATSTDRGGEIARGVEEDARRLGEQ